MEYKDKTLIGTICGIKDNYLWGYGTLLLPNNRLYFGKGDYIHDSAFVYILVFAYEQWSNRTEIDETLLLAKGFRHLESYRGLPTMRWLEERKGSYQTLRMYSALKDNGTPVFICQLNDAPEVAFVTLQDVYDWICPVVALERHEYHKFISAPERTPLEVKLLKMLAQITSSVNTSGQTQAYYIQCEIDGILEAYDNVEPVIPKLPSVWHSDEEDLDYNRAIGDGLLDCGC